MIKSLKTISKPFVIFWKGTKNAIATYRELKLIERNFKYVSYSEESKSSSSYWIPRFEDLFMPDPNQFTFYSEIIESSNSPLELLRIMDQYFTTREAYSKVILKGGSYKVKIVFGKHIKLIESLLDIASQKFMVITQTSINFDALKQEVFASKQARQISMNKWVFTSRENIQRLERVLKMPYYDFLRCIDIYLVDGTWNPDQKVLGHLISFLSDNRLLNDSLNTSKYEIISKTFAEALNISPTGNQPYQSISRNLFTNYPDNLQKEFKSQFDLYIG